MRRILCISIYLLCSLYQYVSGKTNDTMELLGESLASTLADGLIGKIVDVNSYVLFSVGSITFKGNERNLTLGILGNVFSIESFTKPH